MQIPTPKSQAIVDVIAKLRESLGKDSFDIADEWEDDPDAIGIVTPTDPGKLVYIAVYGDKFYVELELPPTSGSELPYELAESYDDIDFEQLVAVLVSHLGENELREKN